MESRNILVTGPAIHEQAAKLVADNGYRLGYVPPYTSEEDLIRVVADADPIGVIIRMGKFGASAIDAAPSLKVISKHGVGVDNVDIEAATRRDIPVVVASGANARSVAEHAIALLLVVVKRILPLDRGLRAGRWEKPGFSGIEVAGLTMGLVGFGAIAKHTAIIAKALGMRIRAFDPFSDESVFVSASVIRDLSVEDLLAASDVVSLHCPLTAETRRLLDIKRLRLMKAGSYVINTARGGLIDEGALLEAIESGHIAGAGLDTFETEPPSPEHPFWKQQKIIVTPHIGGVTQEANIRVGLEAVEGVLAVVQGRGLAPARIVNHRALAKMST
jgi:D-3-phosphoglycerate dehydrogenase / 2-oxoglutarate reductase